MKGGIAFVVRTYLRRYTGLSSELYPPSYRISIIWTWVRYTTLECGMWQTTEQLCDKWHKLVVFQAVFTERGASKGRQAGKGLQEKVRRVHGLKSAVRTVDHVSEW